MEPKFTKIDLTDMQKIKPKNDVFEVIKVPKADFASEKQKIVDKWIDEYNIIIIDPLFTQDTELPKVTFASTLRVLPKRAAARRLKVDPRVAKPKIDS